MITKVIRSTKYLSKQTLIVGIMGCILVVIFLAFRFTSVEMNSETADIDEVREQNQDGAKFDWKTADLLAETIPANINQAGKLHDGSKFGDKTVQIQVVKMIDCTTHYLPR